MKKAKWLALLAGLVSAPAVCAAQTLPSTHAPSAVLFLAGDDPDDAWTRSLAVFGEAAANALGMKFEVVFANHGRKEIMESVVQRIEGREKPDFAVIINYRGVAGDVLTYLNAHEVSTFLFNSGLSEEDYHVYGRPRENLPFWIGEIVPDDERAGYELAEYLIDEARKGDADGTIRVLAFTGAYANPAAVARVRGLKQAVAEAADAELVQIAAARWSAQIAEQKYVLLAARHADIDVVWAANDEMALGVLSALEARGDDVVVGGMDWTPSARKKIKSGALAASMGGHFIDVAYVLSLLNDYYYGRDFALTRGSASLPSFLSLMTPDNISFYEPLFEAKNFASFDYALPVARPDGDERANELSIEQFLNRQRARRGGGR